MLTKQRRVKKKRESEYDEKLNVEGSFIQIMKAAAKNANDKSDKKKK